ncbi:hypothetical protein [Microbacterium sp. SORGH_AS_0888]|uniref:hypothetical protein n=1 Tax=Microbacterium sp. SORGH_AS_0888 TaxID=3041791 RepID=UPI00277DA9E9|nr:hypothetical protein [Microbacterium sp. SORGH_AS_0888]MDQ1131189.1 hypothetical protein [Microbacterium sp. SORGH_AS_0888]
MAADGASAGSGATPEAPAPALEHGAQRIVQHVEGEEAGIAVQEKDVSDRCRLDLEAWGSHAVILTGARATIGGGGAICGW